jgi:hypothetical protein
LGVSWPRLIGSPRDESVRSATGRIRPSGELADKMPMPLYISERERA